MIRTFVKVFTLLSRYSVVAANQGQTGRSSVKLVKVGHEILEINLVGEESGLGPL